MLVMQFYSKTAGLQEFGAYPISASLSPYKHEEEKRPSKSLTVCGQFHQCYTCAFFRQNFGAKNYEAVFWV